MSRVLLVLATVVMASYAYYAAAPLGASTPTPLDAGSVAVAVTLIVAWLWPYVWWYRCVVRHERNVTNYLTEPTEVPKGVA